MRKKSSSVYTFFRMISTMVLIIAVTCTSCSKDNPVDPIPTPGPPPTSPPTGVISSFVITDSLMPFYTGGSMLKWLVTGTNGQTVVTINGVKVLFNGILDTGPLKQTTTFTLLVNNGKQASVVLHVADSVTTLLWNKDKRLKMIKKEFGYYPIGSADITYRDSTMTASEIDQRIYFHYSNTSKILLASNNVQYNGPVFTISRDYKNLSWGGRVYEITQLDANFLNLVSDDPAGTKTKFRYSYQFE
ncbi:MAG: hypothetical protein V4557_04880 [Bacteroidota bacterium]